MPATWFAHWNWPTDVNLRARVCGSIDPIEHSEAWAALTAQGTAGVCGSREWVRTAFEQAHPEARPHLIAVSDGDDLVGMMAMALTGDRSGALMVAGAPHNDLIDVLAAPDRADDVAMAVLTALEREWRRGRRVQLDAIDPDGALARNGHRARWLTWTDDVQAPVVELGPDWTGAFNPAWASQWRRRERRLRQAHDVRVEQLSADATAAAIEEFVALRRARLAARGWPLDRPPEDFLLRAVERLAPSERCALMELRIDGHLAASDLYQLAPPTAMLWLRVFDGDWSAMSPGSLLVRAAGELLRAAGYTTLDLGRGDESYKFDLGARPRMLLSARAPAS